MSGASPDMQWLQWAVGIVLSAFGAIFGAWNIHIQKRLDDLANVLPDKASAGDARLWEVMEQRHDENQQRLALVRSEQQTAHERLLEEFRMLRQAIDNDRRAEIDRLVAEIRDLRKLPATKP